MKNLLTHYKFWLGLLLFGVDGAFFSQTDPRQVSSFVLIAAVGLVVLSLYAILRGVLAVLNLYNPWFGRQKRVVLALTVAGAIVLLMQSIGQLSFHDGVVLVILAVVAYLYAKLSRTRPVSE